MALSNKSTTDVYLLFMVTPPWLLRYPGWLRCICHIAPTRCAARGVAPFLSFSPSLAASSLGNASWPLSACAEYLIALCCCS
jgi:hypothetical protein